MLKKFVFLMAFGAILAFASCGSDEVCLKCDGLPDQCEGDDDGQGGTLTKSNLEDAKAIIDLSGLLDCTLE